MTTSWNFWNFWNFGASSWPWHEFEISIITTKKSTVTHRCPKVPNPHMLPTTPKPFWSQTLRPTPPAPNPRMLPKTPPQNPFGPRPSDPNLQPQTLYPQLGAQNLPPQNHTTVPQTCRPRPSPLSPQVKCAAACRCPLVQLVSHRLVGAAPLDVVWMEQCTEVVDLGGAGAEVGSTGRRLYGKFEADTVGSAAVVHQPPPPVSGERVLLAGEGGGGAAVVLQPPPPVSGERVLLAGEGGEIGRAHV